MTEARDALLAAAERWRHSAWIDAPKRADPLVERIAMANYVGDWLEERANSLGEPATVFPATSSQRLKKIAEQHAQHVDEHGGTSGWCLECEHPWPCPTYRWATEEGLDTCCTWDLADCSFEEHERHVKGALDA